MGSGQRNILNYSKNYTMKGDISMYKQKPNVHNENPGYGILKSKKKKKKGK